MRRESGPPQGTAPRTPAKESDTPHSISSTRRPALGPTPEDHARHLAVARAGTAAIGRAQRAVRLLEVVAAGPRCPAIRAPRHLAAQLRALADELDQTGHLRALVAVSDGVLPVGDTRERAA